jgi:hypothetical protein
MLRAGFSSSLMGTHDDADGHLGEALLVAHGFLDEFEMMGSDVVHDKSVRPQDQQCIVLPNGLERTHVAPNLLFFKAFFQVLHDIFPEMYIFSHIYIFPFHMTQVES